jgi:hypothetical protein
MMKSAQTRIALGTTQRLFRKATVMRVAAVGIEACIVNELQFTHNRIAE